MSSDLNISSRRKAFAQRGAQKTEVLNNLMTKTTAKKMKATPWTFQQTLLPSSVRRNTN